jgi:hypothetical protein
VIQPKLNLQQPKLLKPAEAGNYFKIFFIINACDNWFVMKEEGIPAIWSLAVVW